MNLSNATELVRWSLVLSIYSESICYYVLIHDLVHLSYVFFPLILCMDTLSISNVHLNITNIWFHYIKNRCVQGAIQIHQILNKSPLASLHCPQWHSGCRLNLIVHQTSRYSISKSMQQFNNQCMYWISEM